MVKENALQHPPFVIVTAYQSSLANSYNIAANIGLRERLDRLRYARKSVSGSYEGECEECFLAVVAHLDDAKLIAEYAGKFHDQKTVLYVDENRDGFLIDCNTLEIRPAGKWRNVPETIARAKAAWTFDPAAALYYVCD